MNAPHGFIHLVTALSATAILVGCNSGAQNPVANIHAGTYSGALSVTISDSDVPVAERYAISLVVGENGVVRIIDDRSDPFHRGVVKGEHFFISDHQVVDNHGDITCVGTQTVAGTIRDGFVRAELIARLACNGAAVGPVAVRAHGLITASKALFHSRVVPAGNWERGRAKTLYQLMHAARSRKATPRTHPQGRSMGAAYALLDRKRRRVD